MMRTRKGHYADPSLIGSAAVGVCSDQPKASDGNIRARKTWIREVGPVPDGLLVLHHCDNNQCYRLSHLFLGTQADNLADMRAKGRGSPPPSHKGVKRGPETLAKISAIHKGKPLTEEHRASLREAWKTRPSVTAETRAKTSVSMKRAYAEGRKTPYKGPQI